MMTDGEPDHVAETIRVERMDRVRTLLGQRDHHLRLLRDLFDVRVFMRGAVLTVQGRRSAVAGAARAMREVLAEVERNAGVSAEEVERMLRAAAEPTSEPATDVVDVFPPSRTVKPRTPGQAAYVRAMRKDDLVFCVGPAGSGKTYLAVAVAVSELKRNRVRKIVLTRPAVEAGEKLGFLPGDIHAKVNPYLRPLYDALQDMMGLAQIQKYIENDLVEVAPLAYMRGRTLDRAFIILDEGQNSTRRQMKMFLTRLGASSRCVVTGDISQIDLPESEVSGMIDAMHILDGVRGIGFVRLSQADIVRHSLVQDIVDAYELGHRGVSPERFRSKTSGEG